MKLVIDSSVSLKWILGVEDNEHSLAQAEAILGGVTDGSLLAIQPPHWFAEVTAVIALKRPAKLDMTAPAAQEVAAISAAQATSGGCARAVDAAAKPVAR